MKKIVIISIFVMLSTSMWAQLSVSKSSTVQWIESAVSNCFFISNNNFQIKDKNGKLYGLNNQKEFGAELTLGVKVEGGYILTNRAVHPWEYHPQYNKYRNSYTPVIYQTLYTEIKDTAKYEAIEYNTDEQKALIDSILYFQKASVFHEKGLRINHDEGNKNGWFVWVIANKGSDLLKTSKVEFVIYHNKQGIEANTNKMSVEPPLKDKTLLGGIYIVPDFTELGAVSFRLCGIMFSPQVDQWNVYFPFVGDRLTNSESQNDDTISPKEEKGAELTPIENTSKDKKKSKK